MIPPDRFASIAEGLLSKTKKNELNWVKVGEGFRHTLNSSRIDLWSSSPRTAPDNISLSVAPKENGAQPFGIWIVTEEEPRWSLLANLLFEVQRRCTPLGQVMDEIEHALTSGS